MSTATSLLSLDALSPGRDMESYVRTVNALPYLTREKEHDLAVRFFDHGDLDAARELILCHLRFVAAIARDYRGYGLPDGDLIQEGNIGLMKAVRRFDPYVGVRLTSFAVVWIKAEINEFVVRNWRIVKIATTKAQRKLFFNLRKLKKSLAVLSPSETAEIATDLGVKPHEVKLMESRLLQSDMAFEENPSDEDSPSFPAIVSRAIASDEASNPENTISKIEWEQEMHDRLNTAMKSLDERSLKIIKSRWLSEEKRTLTELGDELGLSRERIRQIESAAMNQIREYLEAA